MARHKLNPEVGEIWHHATLLHSYRIHSVTDDGWVRYFTHWPGQRMLTAYPLFTQPTLDFIRIYERAPYDNG